MGNVYSCKQLPWVSDNTGELLSEEMKGQWPQSSIGFILTKEILLFNYLWFLIQIDITFRNLDKTTISILHAYVI